MNRLITSQNAADLGFVALSGTLAYVGYKLFRLYYRHDKYRPEDELGYVMAGGFSLFGSLVMLSCAVSPWKANNTKF